MATKDAQSTARDQGRQQGSEMTSAPSSYGQHGSGGVGQRGLSTQQTGWQAPGTGQQGSGAGLQARRAGMPTAPYYGAFGGSPFSMLRRMREDMDRLFDSFGSWRSGLPTEFGQAGLPGNATEGAWGLWAPHIDVREHDGKLIIAADLPGVRKDEVNVEITPEAVTIQGERRRESTTDERNYYRSERSYGNFYRTIALPEGAEADTASATFHDGVLQIELQLPRQQAKGRKLEIKER
jgi:HSP20 family protein